jgi:hypothetical protein
MSDETNKLREALQRLHDWALAQEGDCMFSGDHPIAQAAAVLAGVSDAYKPGDPPPGGYLNWHAWAEVQSKAGLEQVQCERCHLWRFPQELAKMTGMETICLQCDSKGK